MSWNSNLIIALTSAKILCYQVTYLTITPWLKINIWHLIKMELQPSIQERVRILSTIIRGSIYWNFFCCLVTKTDIQIQFMSAVSSNRRSFKKEIQKLLNRAWNGCPVILNGILSSCFKFTYSTFLFSTRYLLFIKADDPADNFIKAIFHSKVPRVESMHLGIRQVLEVCFSSFSSKENIILTPEN
jgi:hypothetical protein